MKKSILLFAFLFFTTFMIAQPVWDWGRYGGGAGNDIAYAIATDPSGFSYVTGRFNATLTIGSFSVNSYAGPDIFIAKFDPAGTCLWLRHGGSIDAQDPYGDEGRGISLDGSGNCYVTGVFKGSATFGSFTVGSGSSRNVFVAKYDTNGNPVWVVCPTGGQVNNYSNAIDTDNSGNSWITGYLGGGSNTFGAYTLSGAGGYAVKYDASGAIVFATKFGVNGAIDLYGIATDSNGNSYCSGYLQTSETIGSNTYTSSGMRDAIIVKTDASGNFSWLTQSTAFSGSEAFANAICCDPQNGIYACGHYDNTTIFGNDTLHLSTSFGRDIFIVKYDDNGNEQWAVQSDIQSNFSSQMDGLAITSNTASEIFMTGVYSDDLYFGTTALLSNNSGMNAYIAAFDVTGNCLFTAHSTSQNSGAFGQGISTDNIGGVYICGFDKAPVIFGTDTTQFIGGEDLFVARMSSHIKNAIPEYGTEFHTYLFQDFSGNWMLNIGEENLSQSISFVLYDMTGRKIIELPVRSAKQEISLDGIAAGIYSWTVTDSQKRIGAGKIVVK